MPQLKILGQIEPSWLDMTFDFQPTISYRIDEADINLTCTLSIEQSKITVTCEVNRWDDGVLAWILGYVTDWVNAEANLFTFASGKVLHVRLDRAEYPDGSERQLLEEAPDLAAIVTALTVTGSDGTTHVNLVDGLQIILSNPTLMLALHDLCSAIKPGSNTLTNCARSLEAMRKSLHGSDGNDEADIPGSWRRFRAALQLSEGYLKVITDASRGPRHGSSAYIPSATRQDILRRSWTIMNRMLLFRLGGDTPLSTDDHPLL